MSAALILQFSEAGLQYQVASGKDVGTLLWNDLASATVSKRDLFSYDLICLQLKTRDGRMIELDEEDRQWSSLIENLPEHLPGCEGWNDWFPPVAFPPFELNERVIFRSDPA